MIPLKYVSMSNREFEVRPVIVNINSSETLFYPYSATANKRTGSCNGITNTYSKLCVPNVDKSMDIKVFNLISRTNEARQYIMACNLFM